MRDKRINSPAELHKLGLKVNEEVPRVCQASDASCRSPTRFIIRLSVCTIGLNPGHDLEVTEGLK